MNRWWYMMFLCACVGLHAQTSIDLRGFAAFHPGDDEVWRSKYIDEREGWNFIPVPGAWENHGYPLLDGFAWYRIRFRIPNEMKGDSLLLVISGIDDADETYLNGTGIAKTGDFPPNMHSEPRSLRVYPLPRYLREEHNLLALRVYDMGDYGGITGNIFRIVRADSIPSVLNEIVDEPFRRPNLYLSNGIMVSSFNPSTASIEWAKPHLFNELEQGLKTESILANLTLTFKRDGRQLPLESLRLINHEYVQQSGVIRSSYEEGFDVYWWHPRSTTARVLIIMVLADRPLELSSFGISFTLTKQYWRLEQIDDEQGFEQRRYFVLAYNSCCDDLAERDMKDFLKMSGAPPWTLEREMNYWKTVRNTAFYAPAQFSAPERSSYHQAITSLLLGKVREPGLGYGQIVSAFEPPSRAYTVPRDHLRSCIALAEAGLLDEASEGLEFVRRATTGAYTLFDVYGKEFGVGYPYLITPAFYSGLGAEYQWTRKDDAVLSFDGMAMYIEAFDALLQNSKRKSLVAGRLFNDSAFVAPYWEELSTRVADVLLYVRDTSGLIPRDDSPWGKGLSEEPGIYSSLHAAAALYIAARYARLMKNDLKAFLYEQGASHTLATIRRLIEEARAQSEAAKLSGRVLRLFHPLLIDGITLGLFPRGSDEARFALDVAERGFRIEDTPNMFNARPDGDWFERQARPQIALRLARAYVAIGSIARAEELFSTVTSTASNNNGLLPGLIDPVSGNWYGALPAIGSGAAEYILTAEQIARVRIGRNSR